MQLVCDIETDGLLDELTQLHSLLIEDLDSGKKWSCSHHPEYVSPNGHDTSLSIEDGLRMIMEADLSIWHNGIGFDLQAIRKVYPWFKVLRRKVFDTMVMSLLIWPNLYELDDSLAAKGRLKTLPKKLWGSHSLAAWGHRLGWNKIEFHPESWKDWSAEMQTYGEGDIPVTKRLYQHIVGKNYDRRAIQIEHYAKFICVEQERFGFNFNEKAARQLTSKLMVRRADLEQKLKDTFGTWEEVEVDEIIVPKVNNAKLGYVKGQPFHKRKVKTVVFNPGSRQHIENRLRALYNWKPAEFTPSGQAKIDETTLAGLPWPEAKLLTEYLLVQKRLGQIAEGKQAWLKVVKNGKIHGRINPGGAVTGRATHNEPNVSATPAVKSPYGEECRALWGPPEGFVQVGADCSGLELRMLANRMAKFDGGLYAKIVVEGDVHWVNVQALGLVPQGTERDGKLVIHKLFREGTKTFIYAFLYGAGGEKIGSIVLDIALMEMRDGLGNSVSSKYFQGKAKPGSRLLAQVGNKLKEEFLDKTPALKKLIKAVKEDAKRRGYLIGLDGRRLHVRSEHAALNTMLQSDGALVCKRWMIEVDMEIARRGWRELAHQMAWIHDELQFAVHPSIVEEFKTMVIDCIQKAGAYFGIQCPLTGEAKDGLNWADCH